MTFMKGKLCELRPIENSDYEVARYTKYVNAGWTLDFVFTGSFPIRPIDVRSSWEAVLKSEGREILFGIWVMNASGVMEFVGGCGLHSYRDIYRSREFRIIIFDPEAVEKGVGTEATRLVADYFFRRLNGYKLWLGVNAENVRAVRCYQKAGFKEEGRLRDELWINGKYVDAVRMSILRHEWEAENA